MTATRCPACHGRSTDGHPCHQCWRNHRRRLEALPSLDAELETTIARQDHLGQQSDIRAATVHGPLPYNPEASDVRTTLRATIASWARLLCDDYAHPYPADTITAMATLVADLRQARTHPAALDLHDEIRDIHAAATRAIDYPDERGRIKVGPCPEHDQEGEPCGGLLWAHVPREQPTFMRCDCCTREWDSESWKALGRSVQRRLDQVALQKTYRVAS